MVNRLTYSTHDIGKNYTENNSASLLKAFRSEMYASYHDYPRMKAIMDKLSEAAVF